MAERPFDLAVIGGGIHGAWLARHAARSGLRTTLLERHDLAAGTTSRSSMLAHGGLRYLAMGDFHLVREALKERGSLRRMAPHLVRPLPFLLPFYRGQAYAGWTVAMGVRLYTVLAWGSGFPRHRILGRDDVLKLEPGLEPRGLTGGALYYDGQISSPERLVVEVALDAARHDAFVQTRAQVQSIDAANGRVTGVVVRTDAGEVSIPARCVVNTAGPWLEDVLAGTPARDERVRLTKGIHLVTPAFTRHAVVVTGDDGRVMFAIPWRGLQLVGTTDTDFTGDKDDVWADAADVRYVQDSVRRHFPDAPVERVHATTAGLRNLMNVPGLAPSRVTREARIEHHAKAGLRGAFSLVGGKLTTARRTSHALLRRAAKHLKVSSTPLDEAPLPGACDPAIAAAEAAAWAGRHGLEPATGERLAHVLGSRWRDAATLGHELLCKDAPVLSGQVILAARQEWARDVVDVLRRRTSAWAEPCNALEAADIVAELLQAEGHKGATADAWRAFVRRNRAW